VKLRCRVVSTEVLLASRGLQTFACPLYESLTEVSFPGFPLGLDRPRTARQAYGLPSSSFGVGA